jgi:ElaA protein
MQIEWHQKHFKELTLSECYKMLQLRSDIFVVEQDCVYLDCDGKDEEAYHLFATVGDAVIACTRILAPGVAYDAPSIGRVAVIASHRKTGLGKILMEKSIQFTAELYPNNPIELGGQLYLKRFYNDLGFEQISEMYLEDGIEHIKMRRGGVNY